MTRQPQRSEEIDVRAGGVEVGRRRGAERPKASGWGSWLVVVAVAVGIGLLVGFLVSGRPSDRPTMSTEQYMDLPEEFALGVSLGEIGPELLAAGAIDYPRFVDLYRSRGNALTESQLAALVDGSDAPIVIDHDNAGFLLNLFWAFGLTNQNPLLEEGPMVAHSQGEVGRFASTGGWTLGTRPSVDLYSSAPIVILTPEQQARLEEVASGVYRPCCNNPTSFPDCNHGMAMLGLLELMASENATVDEMFLAAKHVNAFWFPQQTVEVAMLFRHALGQDFSQADAREFVGFSMFSASGFQGVHQWLASNDLLGSTPGLGGSCGV